MRLNVYYRILSYYVFGYLYFIMWLFCYDSTGINYTKLNNSIHLFCSSNIWKHRNLNTNAHSYVIILLDYTGINCTKLNKYIIILTLESLVSNPFESFHIMCLAVYILLCDYFVPTLLASIIQSWVIKYKFMMRLFNLFVLSLYSDDEVWKVIWNQMR